MKRWLFLLIGMSFISLHAQAKLASFHGVKNDVVLTVMPCRKNEMLVKTDDWKLNTTDFLKGGYVPLRISIENKSDTAISISDNSIRNLDLSMREMAECLEYSKVGRSLLWWSLRNVPSFALMIGAWHCYISGSRGALQLALVGRALFGLNTCIGIPYDWIRLQSLNEQLPGKLHAALLTGSVSIAPGARAEKIFVIPDWKCILFEFQVFDQRGSEAMTEFMVAVW